MPQIDDSDTDTPPTTETSRRPVSLTTVAAAAHVSISTVSRVVNGQSHRVSKETLQRVQMAIKTLGYRPNQIGRALKQGRTRIVAMLTAGLDNPVMSTIAASTEAALRNAGYVMIVCDTHDQAQLQDEYLEAMRSQGVEGYILVTNVKSHGLEQFVDQKEPIIFACRRNPYADGFYVGIDNRAAGSAAADHLLDAGCRRFAVVTPELLSSVTKERMSGFTERLAERGIAANAIQHLKASGASLQETGFRATTDLRTPEDWPDGILCVSDLLAYGVHRQAVSRGLSVPKDCKLISIDGSEMNDWLAPWLTSVHVAYQDFGPLIVSQLESVWQRHAPYEDILPITVS